METKNYEINNACVINNNAGAKIIAVAGASGAGKSTLIRCLKEDADSIPLLGGGKRAVSKIGFTDPLIHDFLLTFGDKISKSDASLIASGASEARNTPKDYLCGASIREVMLAHSLSAKILNGEDVWLRQIPEFMNRKLDEMKKEQWAFFIKCSSILFLDSLRTVSEVDFCKENNIPIVFVEREKALETGFYDFEQELNYAREQANLLVSSDALHSVSIDDIIALNSNEKALPNVVVSTFHEDAPSIFNS